VIQKLTGPPIHTPSSSPVQALKSASTIDRASARRGRLVSAAAAAAGATKRENTSSTPTIWIATTVVSANSDMKSSDIARGDSPRDAADCASTDTKSIGRKVSDTASSTTNERAATIPTSADDTPRICPKRIE
jgi:hypothetical protein